ncbi:hypothetical protein M440DRAFT_310018 [Trichoderma longibrachiatum ATCC 18648]|uniref:Uncharacterized protein n=1 Tax=Trichoderma longibrachiatum ATCC 18648 TaxID=983965 RepID=A0A2T4C661_TRILO|nr:hypothetical protein M440DRAFT_310018 [Trichoderma longibrachiatum ATCC 18648]
MMLARHSRCIYSTYHVPKAHPGGGLRQYEHPGRAHSARASVAADQRCACGMRSAEETVRGPAMIPFSTPRSRILLLVWQRNRPKAAVGGPVASGRMHGATHMRRTIRRRARRVFDVGWGLDTIIPSVLGCLMRTSAS